MGTKTTIRMGDRVREVALERRGARVVASVDGREYRLPFAEITKAHRIYKFTRDDFAPHASPKRVRPCSA